MSNFIEINVSDEIKPLLERLGKRSKRSIKSASKSLGWFIQSEIKEGIRSGHPGGEQFKERIPLEVRQKLGKGSAASEWYGQMVNAIGYQYNEGILRIGWASKTSSVYGNKQEFGYRTKVTDAIRKHYAEAGVPLNKEKQYLELPDRPFFEPMADELRPKVAPYIQTKLT